MQRLRPGGEETVLLWSGRARLVRPHLHHPNNNITLHNVHNNDNNDNNDNYENSSVFAEVLYEGRRLPILKVSLTQKLFKKTKREGEEEK
jgi:hypothetical protein